MASLQIKYRLKYWDTFRFNLFHFKMSKTTKYILLAYVAFISWQMWNAIEHPPIVKVLMILIIIGGFLGLSLLLFTPLLALLLLRRKHRDWYIDHTITIEDDSLVEDSANGRIKTKWGDILKIAKTRNLIFAYHEPKGAHLIPRRAFQTSGEFDLFFHEIGTRFNAAKEASKK